MADSNGWVKIWRRIWHSEIWEDGEPFCKRAAWIDLILMANHEPHTIRIKGEEVEIRRGDVHTSIAKLATRWKWSENKVRRFVGRLCERGMVQTKRQGNGTTLTVEKYAFYQDWRRTDERTGERTDERTNRRTCGTQTRRSKKTPPPGRLGGLPEGMESWDDFGPPVF